jgi:hypothetical protein
MSLLRFPTKTLAVVLLLSAAGCKDREITAYRLPKEPVPVATAPKAALPASGQLPDGHPPIGGGAPAGESAVPAAVPAATAPNGSAMGALPDSAVAAGNALTWSAPASWQAKAPGSVRKGSYAIVGDAGATGDLGITAFPGDTGGLHANINRWRGQIGLQPAGPAEIEGNLERFQANGLSIDFVDLTGPQGVRLLGAIVPFNNETWFFKLTGPEALIARERAAFRAFLDTVKPR